MQNNPANMGWENEMTREEKIEFLSRYREIDNEINRLCEELSVWRARVTKITPTYSSLPRGSQQDDKLQSAIEKIMELEQEIDAEIDMLYKEKRAIKRAILTVKDKTLRKLLLLKYICKENCSWDKVALELGYTYRHITRMHGMALDRLHIDSCP